LIKSINANDIKDIKDISIELYNDSGSPGTLNWESFKEFWEKVLNNDAGVVYGFYVNGKPAGTIMGLLNADFNTGEIVGTEVHWIIKDGYKSSGFRLLKMFINWAKDRGAKRIIIGGPYENRKAYSRFGFKPLRMAYYMEV